MLKVHLAEVALVNSLRGTFAEISKGKARKGTLEAYPTYAKLSLLKNFQSLNFNKTISLLC